MAEQNGAPRWRDIERLERKDAVLEEGQRWLSRMGERHNEQINEAREDIHDMKEQIADVPVLRNEIKGLKKSADRAATAGWGVIIALVGLMGTVLWQGLHP